MDRKDISEAEATELNRVGGKVGGWIKDDSDTFSLERWTLFSTFQDQKYALKNMGLDIETGDLENIT